MLDSVRVELVPEGTSRDDEVVSSILAEGNSFFLPKFFFSGLECMQRAHRSGCKSAETCVRTQRAWRRSFQTQT